ncbi:hypothetical protein SAZ11_56315 [Streptomyces sp. FXJ1.4098]|nr:hypothetical protein [Streptomyces sp. FXJ1.4098]
MAPGRITGRDEHQHELLAARPKILRRPYVLGVALYTAAYRKLKGVYNYQPAEAAS